MKRRSLFRLLPLFMVLILLLPFFPQHASAAEKRVIRVGWHALPGYQDLDSHGYPYGFNYEYLTDLAKYADWTYEFVTENSAGQPLTQADGLSMLADGKLDLLGCMLYSDERTERYSYSALPAGQTFTSLFVRNDSPLTGDDFSALNGITVATERTSLVVEQLSAYAEECGFSIGSYEDYATVPDVTDAVLSGEADAGVLISYQPGSQTRIIANFAPEPFYFITTAGNTDVLSALDQGMNALMINNPYYAQALSVKYHQTYSAQASFSKKELAFLQNADPVRVCVSDASYPLLEFNKITGTVSGIVADVFTDLSAETGLQFVYQYAGSYDDALELVSSGACDILACFPYETRTAEDYGILPTDPYLTLQLVRITKPGEINPAPLVGMLADCAGYDDVANNPNARYRFYNSPAACFEALRKGEVDEIIVTTTAAGYYLAQTRYTQLIRTPLQGVTSNISIGVSEQYDAADLLHSALDKALSSVTDARINQYALENTIKSSGSLEAMINRLPTTTALIIILVLFLLLLLLILFFRAFVHQSRQAEVLSADAKKKAELAREAAERINELLVMDERTGLYNETGFALTARRSIDNDPNARWFILDFDIDDFSHYNATYGFARGDEVLRLLSDSIKSALCESGELCARFYADHFVCLLHADSIDEVRRRAMTLNTALRRADGIHPLLLNYGIYPIDDVALPISAMCDRAQAAKRTVKGNYESIIGVFDEHVHQQQLADAMLISRMQTGLENEEFIAYYQPKYDIQTEQISGAEALVRWRHGDELIMPGRFIGLFEKNGLISKLDFYMLDAVCRRLRAQLDAGLDARPISLNFSRNHLYDPTFLTHLADVVARSQVPPRLLVIEFTEYACLENGHDLIRVIDGVHAMGMQVSIDDFGSGYSSLNMLKDMNFDEVKLDRGFLSPSADVERGQTVIQAVLALSRELHLSTVAEGVETREQLDFLRQSGCDHAQGYYFSRPVPAEEYDRLLRS